MLTDLKQSDIYVGFRQSADALRCGNVKKAYVAKDADEHILRQIVSLCEQSKTELCFVDSKKTLGKAAGINVPAACVVILK